MLIAAAPDLLAALILIAQHARKIWEDKSRVNVISCQLRDEIADIIALSESAIAKIRGTTDPTTGTPEAGYYPGSLADPRIDMKTPKDPETCRHPARRLYSWFAHDPRVKKSKWGPGIVLCVACCDCGKVLAGGI